MRLRVENAKKASQRRAERERERERERAMADVVTQTLAKKEPKNTAGLKQVAAPAVASVAAVLGGGGGKSLEAGEGMCAQTVLGPTSPGQEEIATRAAKARGEEEEEIATRVARGSETHHRVAASTHPFR